jgi:hypothetical protein
VLPTGGVAPLHHRLISVTPPGNAVNDFWTRKSGVYRI